MPTELKRITIAEMRELFQEDHGWIEDVISNEKIFEYELAKLPGIKIRVHSAVSARGRARQVKGIRILVVDSFIDKELRESTSIKHEENWRDKIKDRIQEIIPELYIDPSLEARIKREAVPTPE